MSAIPYAIKHKFVLQSDKRTSGSISAPVFSGLKRFTLTKSDVIAIQWIVPPLSNVTAILGNNVVHVDTQDAGVAYTTLTLAATKVRYFNVISLLLDLKSMLDTQEIADAGSATYTATYNKITDRVTITKSIGNFGLNIVSGDMLNFLGFTIGALTGAATYTATGSVNMYRDIVCLKSNLISFIQHGNDRQPDIMPTSMITDAVMDVLYIKEADKKTEEHDGESRFLVVHDQTLNELTFTLTYIDGKPIEIRNPFTVIIRVESPGVA